MPTFYKMQNSGVASRRNMTPSSGGASRGSTAASVLAMIGVVGMGLVGCAGAGGADGEILAADSAIRDQVVAYDAVRDTSRLTLTVESEPGERLLIIGQLTDSATRRPIPNWTVAIYQSDASGSYGAADPNDESSARIQGAVVTDSVGRFRITTVLPGEANRHIHLGVQGARPEAYDLYFSQYIGFGLRRWAEKSSQAFVVELYRLDANQLVLTANVVARGISLNTVIMPTVGQNP